MKPIQSAPLVPDDQLQEHDFAVGDFDGERELYEQGFVRPNRSFYRSKQLSARRPPIARRVFRTVTRFVVAVLIGVGLTLAWQSYGDQATEIANLWVPSLARMLPATPPKAPGEADVLPQLAQQIKLIALDVAIVRRSVSQIETNQDQQSAEQDQLTQNIAALQQLEQADRQKAVSPAPRSVHPVVQNTLQVAPR